MFGVYRTLLALAVAAAHLGGLTTGAHYAVFGFFILSGYLMTLILHQTYGYSGVGCGRYLLNRALRLYPPYWAAAALSALLVLWVGKRAATFYHGSMFLPEKWQGVVENAALLFRYVSEPRLVPPAWALTVELFYYLCLGLGLSRTKKLTVGWFAVSAIYTIVINILKVDFDVKYFLIPAASLPFSTGALIYHFRAEILARCPLFNDRRAPLVLFAVWILDLTLALKKNAYFGWGFYASYAINAAIVISLLDKRSLPAISKPLDTFLGDFSYPIYLVHYQSGLILVAAGLRAVKRGQGLFFLAALPLLIALAWSVTRFVEWPMEGIRTRVKLTRIRAGLSATAKVEEAEAESHLKGVLPK
jgi:peptidoglycan/LPS O-acetylase OafA/YrhL